MAIYEDLMQKRRSEFMQEDGHPDEKYSLNRSWYSQECLSDESFDDEEIQSAYGANRFQLEPGKQ